MKKTRKPADRCGAQHEEALPLELVFSWWDEAAGSRAWASVGLTPGALRDQRWERIEARELFGLLDSARSRRLHRTLQRAEARRQALSTEAGAPLASLLAAKSLSEALARGGSDMMGEWSCGLGEAPELAPRLSAYFEGGAMDSRRVWAVVCLWAQEAAGDAAVMLEQDHEEVVQGEKRKAFEGRLGSLMEQEALAAALASPVGARGRGVWGCEGRPRV